MTTPTHYRAPLRSRSDILAFLKTAANSRPQYGLFAFNVKLYGCNLSFEHLAKLAREAGELREDASARYLTACRERLDAQSLYETAIEDARDHVTGDDCNRMLWDGSETVAEWSFAGRSGGWLVLDSFEGVSLAPTVRHAGDPWENVEGMRYPQLRRLYRFVVQCLYDFRREAVRAEVEHQAAFHLFANVCADIETDDQAAEREAAEQAETVEREHWEARDTVTV